MTSDKWFVRSPQGSDSNVCICMRYRPLRPSFHHPCIHFSFSNHPVFVYSFSSVIRSFSVPGVTIFGFGGYVVLSGWWWVVGYKTRNTHWQIQIISRICIQLSIHLVLHAWSYTLRKAQRKPGIPISTAAIPLRHCGMFVCLLTVPPRTQCPPGSLGQMTCLSARLAMSCDPGCNAHVAGALRWQFRSLRTCSLGILWVLGKIPENMHLRT